MKISQINPWPVRQYDRIFSVKSKQKFDSLLSRFRNTNQHHELVIVVDGTALLYRRAFTYLNEKSIIAASASSSSSSSSTKKEKNKNKNKNTKPTTPPVGFEVDPTKWLQSNLTTSLKFLHSVIPFGDGDEKFQPDIVPVELLLEGMKCGRVNHSGGLMKRGASELAYLAKMRGKENPLVLQEEISDEYLKEVVPSSLSSSQSSSILKRKILFCFDHGAKRNDRFKIVHDYKGQRPKKCGRVVSFVNYGVALVRQLADGCKTKCDTNLSNNNKIIHGVFPSEMKTIDLVVEEERTDHSSHTEFESPKALEKFMSSSSARVVSKSSKNKHSLPSTSSRKFLKSLFQASTSENPYSLQKITGEADDAVHTIVNYYVKQNEKFALCQNKHNNEKKSKKICSSSLSSSSASLLPRYSILIISSDKDLMQLLEHPNTYYFHLTSNSFVTRKEVCEKKFHGGIESPKQIVDFLTLTGDSVDNVRGIPMTGNKKAALILKKFGSVEGLVKACEDEAKKKNAKHNTTKFINIDMTEDEGHKNIKSNNSNKAPGVYEKLLFDFVKENGKHLIDVKKHVISLRELPWVKNKLSFEEAHHRQSSSSSFSDFIKLENEGLFRGQNLFRRSHCENVFASNKKLTESFWRLIRQYYSKNYGVCYEKNEKEHGCGVKDKKKKF